MKRRVTDAAVRSQALGHHCQSLLDQEMRKGQPILPELRRTRSCNFDGQIEVLCGMRKKPGCEGSHINLIRARHGNFVEHLR